MAGSDHLFGRDGSWIVVAGEAEAITTPALTANFICRVLLATLANIICLVPLKNLFRNSEFAAVVFILNIEVTNLDTIVNALIWRNDDTDSWWAGYGLCDLSPYIHNLNIALFVTCLLAMMRNLAQQVGLLRANPLTVREKRRRHLVQALIIFPLPIIQLCWVWPLTAQRYVVGTLVGCSWVASPSWPYIVFFVIAPVVIAIMTSGYAILTYIRFREVARATRSAVSSNRLTTQRAQRTKRRLYLMVISILVPFLPIIITLAVINFMVAFPLQPFDYHLIHNPPFPNMWSNIIFLPSKGVPFVYMNSCYIAILATIPVFIFFGTTKDAMNSYRLGLLFIGLGYIFPKLHEEYDPDRDAYGSSSGNTHLMTSTGTSSSSPPQSKLRSFLSSRHIPSLSTSSAGSFRHAPMHSIDLTLAAQDVEQGPEPVQPQAPQSNPWEVSYPPPTAPSTTALNRAPEPITSLTPNPFLFRTRFDFPTIPLPSIPSFSFGRKKNRHPQLERGFPLESLPSVVNNPHWDTTDLSTEPSHIQTHAWSDDQTQLSVSTPDTSLLVSSTSGQSVTVETMLAQTYRQ
ncbi:hypothetical protein CEP54_004158 [Fusarium duplospermum]|uniref:Pheromone a factor receptor n=1 Tax=Fusarium duplospermum TaxID=1325734 RepID=A0A428QJZ2_9HYPO|nr:hypothetical protein CEP54_004158 [Fusarium duplospermum]